MPREVADAVKALIHRRSADLSRLSISWFGGEPLLNSKLLLEIGGFCKDIACANPQFQYLGDATTNGYLLDVNMARNLINAGVDRFQISLDGGQKSHDESRPQASGAGSFDTIWKNLLDLKASALGFKILLRIHYDLNDWRLKIEFAKQLNEVFGGDSRFKFFFKNLVRMGGRNDESIAVVTSQQRTEAEAALYGAVHASMHAFPNLGLPGGYVCYAAKANSLVIRADGRIQKCTVALESDHNYVGRLLPGGTIEISQEKFKTWIRGLFSNDATELACPNSKFSSEQPLKFMPPPAKTLV